MLYTINLSGKSTYRVDCSCYSLLGNSYVNLAYDCYKHAEAEQLGRNASMQIRD